VSRRVADALDLPHLDTGSTYRIIGLIAVRNGAPLSDADAILTAVAASTFDIEDGVVTLDGENVTEVLRTDRVTRASSTVASLPTVRAHIVAWQQEWVDRHGGSAVVEGRDIGTVVFPDALLKIYLTARPEVRATRRSGDEEAAGKSNAEIAAELAARDHADSTRKASPLKPADDAVIIDTSDLSIEGVVDEIVHLVAAGA